MKKSYMKIYISSIEQTLIVPEENALLTIGSELDNMPIGEKEEFLIEHVQMTEEEYSKLPEFEA